MASRAFKNALSRNLPVLFVYVGWTVHYNGTEVVTGGHKYIREHPGQVVGESEAFLADDYGYFRCGVGNGRLPAGPIHIVFVARDRDDKVLKVVGVYAAADVSLDAIGWALARTRFAERIPIEQRMPVRSWPGRQGMRRWAARNESVEHQALLSLFHMIADGLSSVTGLPRTTVAATADDDDEHGTEGEERKLLVRHRKREQRFRTRKIAEVMKQNGGQLVCEVPRCGFDFHARYGELGAGFAEVHHKVQLSEAPRQGRTTRLRDLAVVCANCHRMIHRNRQCRPMESLIPE